MCSAMNSVILRICALPLLLVGLTSCGQPTDTRSEAKDSPFEEQLRLAFETAQPGDVIEIPQGTYAFDRSLTLSTDGVTIRGAGMS